MSKDNKDVEPLVRGGTDTEVFSRREDVDNDGTWLKYIIASNSTGTGSFVAFVFAAIIFFSFGYYTKYKEVRNQGVQITQQAEQNNTLDSEALAAMKNKDETLNQSLREIGFDNNEIAFLYKGERSRFSVIKDKFTKFLPGKKITKFLPGKTVTKYVPRKDCENDYLGDSESNDANRIISDAYNGRASQQ